MGKKGGKGGGKSKRKAKNADGFKRELTFKEDGQ